MLKAKNGKRAAHWVLWRSVEASAFSRSAWCLRVAPCSGGLRPGWTAHVCVVAGTAHYIFRWEKGFGNEGTSTLTRVLSQRETFLGRSTFCELRIWTWHCRELSTSRNPLDLVGDPQGYSFTLTLVASEHYFLALNRNC